MLYKFVYRLNTCKSYCYKYKLENICLRQCGFKTSHVGAPKSLNDMNKSLGFKVRQFESRPRITRWLRKIYIDAKFVVYKKSHLCTISYMVNDHFLSI